MSRSKPGRIVLRYLGTHATMQLQGDSMTIELQGRTLHFATKAGAIAYFNPPWGCWQAVMRARREWTVGGGSPCLGCRRPAAHRDVGGSDSAPRWLAS
jgi:hypothetical protein